MKGTLTRLIASNLKTNKSRFEMTISSAFYSAINNIIIAVVNA